jgi:hypothetical protein
MRGRGRLNPLDLDHVFTCFPSTFSPCRFPGSIAFEDWMRQHLGYDLELKVYEWIRMLRCMPWWDAYYEERVALGDRKTPDLDGFHFLLRGIELPKVRGDGARERGEGVCGCWRPGGVGLVCRWLFVLLSAEPLPHPAQSNVNQRQPTATANRHRIPAPPAALPRRVDRQLPAAAAEPHFRRPAAARL